VRSCARHQGTPANTKTNWEQEKPIANPITNLGVNKQVFFWGGGSCRSEVKCHSAICCRVIIIIISYFFMTIIITIIIIIILVQLVSAFLSLGCMVERSLCEFYKGFFCRKNPKISRFQDNAQQENNFLICLIVPELGFNI